jgi:hypothetical protein
LLLYWRNECEIQHWIPEGVIYYDTHVVLGVAVPLGLAVF